MGEADALSSSTFRRLEHYCIKLNATIDAIETAGEWVLGLPWRDSREETETDLLRKITKLDELLKAHEIVA